MKKYIISLLIAALCAGISACEADKPTAVEDDFIDDPIVEVNIPKVILSNRSGDVSNVLSGDDAKFFAELISDDSRYVQTMPNCLMDCYLTVDGVSMHYHSDCGNLIRWDNGKCLTLTEEEKGLLNGIFGKYMTLGFAKVDAFDSVEKESSDEISDEPETEPEANDDADESVTTVYVGQSLSSSEPSSFVKALPQEYASKILEILSDESRFIDGTADCLNDCFVAINTQTISYHSECGTFNDNANNRSLKLSDSEREEVNRIISEFIDIGTSSVNNEPGASQY